MAGASAKELEFVIGRHFAAMQKALAKEMEDVLASLILDEDCRKTDGACASRASAATLAYRLSSRSDDDLAPILWDAMPEVHLATISCPLSSAASEPHRKASSSSAFLCLPAKSSPEEGAAAHKPETEAHLMQKNPSAQSCLSSDSASMLRDEMQEVVPGRSSSLTLAGGRSPAAASGPSRRSRSPGKVKLEVPEHPDLPSKCIPGMTESEDPDGLILHLDGALQLPGATPSSGTQSATGPPGTSSRSRKSVASSDPKAVFELWPAWKAQNNSFVERIACNRTSLMLGETQGENPFQVSQLFRTWGVINPNSPVVVSWNLVFICVLCYELIMLPLKVFPLPEDSGYFVLSVLAVVFWSMDVVMGFFVGYFAKNGHLVMGMRQIAARYASTWLVPDVLIVTLDWILLLTEQSALDNMPSVLRLGKVLRYIRVLRVLRLLRLRKLLETIHALEEVFSSEYFSISKNVFLNMLGILAISHFLGCGWFWVGSQRVAGYPSWVERYDLSDSSWGYQYLTSLHWSLTQITPGSMHIQPQNIPERAFAVMVLILGIIVFSSIVSSITSAVNHLKSIGARYEKQRWTMRRFFREQGVSADLVSRVTRYADSIIRPQQRRVGRHEVELLRLLPTSLYMDVLVELFQPHTGVHPLFRGLYTHNKAVMQKVCCDLSIAHHPKDDVLFIPGMAAKAMYFVIQGLFHYQMMDAAKIGVRPSGWFCEPVLWTPWVHQGSMEATFDSEIVVLDSRKFQDVVSDHRSDMWSIKKYASEFVRRMNEVAVNVGMNSESFDGGTSLSDLMTVESAVAVLAELPPRSPTESKRRFSNMFSSIALPATTASSVET